MVDPTNLVQNSIAAIQSITEVAQQPVRTVADFTERVDTAADAGQKSILLLIRRAGNPRFVALALPE